MKAFRQKYALAPYNSSVIYYGVYLCDKHKNNYQIYHDGVSIFEHLMIYTFGTVRS